MSDAPLRVTMVNKLYPPWNGGMEIHLQQLSRALAARHDTQVRVVVGQRGPSRAITDRDGRVTVHRAFTLARVARTPVTVGLRRLLEQPGDILHLHAPYPWGELAVLRSRVTIPIVVTHYHDVIRQRALGVLYEPVRRALYARARRIVVWSKQALESQSLRAYAAKAVLMSGGIDLSPFGAATEARAAELRRRHGSGPLALFVGRLVYYKGLDVLVQAAARTSTTVLVVGDGPLREPIERLSRSLGIAQRVRFCGEVSADDLPAYYRAADYLVLPSTAATEAFGLVQVEAHASGIPSICTELGTGTSSVNLDGVTGLVVPPRDVDALSRAMNLLSGDAALRARLGAQAQARAWREFGIERCASDMRELYAEVSD